ncbi:hypothetical protein ACA910_012298 [Epithemia clementina (nom. ined.)]
METKRSVIFSVFMLAASATVSLAGQCSTIADIACNEPGFTKLCAALTAADLKETLESTSKFTVFAPSDDAFDNLPAGVLEALLNDIPSLKDVLLFHVKEGSFYKEDLTCTHLLEMSNGIDSRTVCTNDGIYQKGAGNMVDQMPKITVANVGACNGVVHVVNQVMLPRPLDQPGKCSSIAEIACSTDGFSKLCAAVKAAGLDEALSGDDKLTVFVPTDVAFGNLPDGLLDSLLDDVPMLSDLLLFHAVQGEIYSTDLECAHALMMMNGKNSRTVCRGSKIYQKGDGNADDHKPEIIGTDIEACNGVIHVVSEVMIPPTEECYSITEIACGSGDFTTLCTALRASGLDDVLDGTDKFTVFAPTDDAFKNLPAGALDGLLGDIDSLKYVLLFHVIAGEVYSSDLECGTPVTMVNEEDSRTVCHQGHVFQKGEGNPPNKKPEIVAVDIEACNGVVHVVDHVMLPPP